MSRKEPNEHDPLLRGKASAAQTNGQEAGEMSVQVRKISHTVTVEPIIILFFTAFTANTPVTQQYIYGQIGLKYNVSNQGVPDQNECSLNASLQESDIQDKVQSETSQWMQVSTIALILPMIFSTWILGTYSDKTGRKIGIILPLLGTAVFMAGCVVVTALELPFWYIFVINCISGFSGGQTTLLMASYAYIADVTETTERSKRMVIVSLCEGVGAVLVQVGISYVIEYVGFSWSFAILGIFNALCIPYAIFWLEETIVKQKDTVIFSMEHFMKPIRLYIRDNGTNRRWQIHLISIVILVQNLIVVGTSTITTLFLYARPLCFGPIELGVFNGIQCISGVVTTLLVMWCCLVKMKDTGLLIFGCISLAAYLILLAFADQAFIVYIALLIGSANGLVTPLCRSFLSKSVNAQEQGALFFALSLCMLASVLVGSLVFLSVYDATLTLMRGFSFLVGAGMTIIMAGLCLCVFKYEKSTLISAKSEKKENC